MAGGAVQFRLVFNLMSKENFPNPEGKNEEVKKVLFGEDEYVPGSAKERLAQRAEEYVQNQQKELKPWKERGLDAEGLNILRWGNTAAERDYFNPEGAMDFIEHGFRNLDEKESFELEAMGDIPAIFLKDVVDRGEHFIELLFEYATKATGKNRVRAMGAIRYVRRAMGKEKFKAALGNLGLTEEMVQNLAKQGEEEARLEK